MAKVKRFRAEYGTSVELGNGRWEKFHCAIEIEPEEEDQMEDVKRKAWDTVFTEIEKQIRSI